MDRPTLLITVPSLSPIMFMARKKGLRNTFSCVVVSVFFCATLYHHYLRHAFSSPAIISTVYYAGRRNLTDASTTAVLLPDWEVLVIVSTETILSNFSGYSCLFYTREFTEASFSGYLRFPNRATFTCLLPVRARRRLPFKQPLLLKTSDLQERDLFPPPAPPLLFRWSYIVYDSLTTDENDVVLFVKGVNTRQGTNRQPSEFRCVFGDDGVRTTVTNSIQEVFRCNRPELTAADAADQTVKVSLEIVAENVVVPSVAYYTPPRKLDASNARPLLCATTMVYDVTKFLREWIIYHSRIGVEKFLLYDNGSDDDLGRVVDELIQQGFDINTYFWPWPKTQEAGFSHSVLYAQNVCTWMMYLDVDEFIYSPPWQNLSKPSTLLLHSLILSTNSSPSKVGQISISCHEFGPSDQTIHPAMGVIQGYNCRRRSANRHKSIALLEAIDDSLLNFVHHFYLKSGYKAKTMNITEMVVNHYKYQAWPEFKAKFRRRVSAYVLDWTQKFNPNSNDRTPGLGFSPVEPEGWPQKFCEVRDDRLKDLATKWFGIESDSVFKMAWQRRL